MTGMAAVHSLTITPSSRIAETSATTFFITVISAMAVWSTPADSMGLRVFTGAPAFTRSRECTPARSAALLTAGMSEAFRLAGGRALEAASMAAVFKAVVFMAVEADAIGSDS
jgi:hypothetical protein